MKHGGGIKGLDDKSSGIEILMPKLSPKSLEGEMFFLEGEMFFSFFSSCNNFTCPSMPQTVEEPEDYNLNGAKLSEQNARVFAAQMVCLSLLFAF